MLSLAALLAWLESLFGSSPGEARPRPAPTSPLRTFVPAPAAPVAVDDPIVSPAYPWLIQPPWGPAERAALLELQLAANLDPKIGGVPGVIDHETGGDPTLPKAASGTPRGGVTQITVGANLPGYTTAEAVWAIRSMPLVEQLRGPVRAYFVRMFSKGTPADQSVKHLLRLNFLPADASKSDDFRLGDRDAVKPDGSPDTWRRNVYAANPGFDRSGRGHFTWSDVDAQAAGSARRGASGWYTVAGKLIPSGSAPPAPSAPAPAPIAPAVVAANRFNFPSAAPAPRAPVPVPAAAPPAAAAPVASTWFSKGGQGGPPVGPRELEAAHPGPGPAAVADPLDPVKTGEMGPELGGGVDPAQWSAHGGQAAPPAPSAPAPAPAPSSPAPSSLDASGSAPAITALLAAVDARWPARLRTSDGIMPSAAHTAANPLSDHERGDALDITYDPVNGPNLDDLAIVLLGDARVTYVIWNRRIANRAIDAGAWRPYERTSGVYNPHTRHLHVSIDHAQRDDARPWATGAVAPATSPPGDEASTIRRGILTAWNGGEVDNVTWVPLSLGGYQLSVSAEPLSVRGLRLPVSFEEQLAIAASIKALPVTREISNARWAFAERRMTAKPAGGPALKNDVAQVLEQNRRLGPVGTTLADGGWKEWVAPAGMPEGRGAQYGFRREDGSTWQAGLGWPHEATWKDYSNTPTLVLRRALGPDGQTVDLLDVLASGALGGPLPAWVVQRLGGGALAPVA